MERWIQKYVVDHGLCPFAAPNRSNHRIVVYSSTKVPRVFEIGGLITAELENLLKEGREEGIPSCFLVFPRATKGVRVPGGFNSLNYFDGITYRSLMQNQEDSGMEVLRYHPNFRKPMYESLQEKTGQPLPRDLTEILELHSKYELECFLTPDEDDRKYLPFRSPWPALQIFLKEDLAEARNSEEGRKIRQHNEATLSSTETVDRLDRIRRACAVPAIRVTREPTPEQRATLEEDGYRIEVIDVETKTGQKSQKTVRKGGLKEPSWKKGKGKRRR